MLQSEYQALGSEEVSEGLPIITRETRISKLFYEFATIHYTKENFGRAAINYLRAISINPFIGYYYWPKTNLRFTLPYRLLKVYFLFFWSSSKAVFFKALKYLNPAQKNSLPAKVKK